MSDNLLQKIEEKVGTLLNEFDTLRQEIARLKHENFALKTEQMNYNKKLQELVSLLDALDNREAHVSAELEIG